MLEELKESAICIIEKFENTNLSIKNISSINSYGSKYLLEDLLEVKSSILLGYINLDITYYIERDSLIINMVDHSINYNGQIYLIKKSNIVARLTGNKKYVNYFVGTDKILPWYTIIKIIERIRFILGRKRVKLIYSRPILQFLMQNNIYFSLIEQDIYPLSTKFNIDLCQLFNFKGNL